MNPHEAEPSPQPLLSAAQAGSGGRVGGGGQSPALSLLAGLQGEGLTAKRRTGRSLFLLIFFFLFKKWISIPAFFHRDM